MCLCLQVEFMAALEGMTSVLRQEYKRVLVGGTQLIADDGSTSDDAGGRPWMAVQTECLHDPRRGSWRYFVSTRQSNPPLLYFELRF